jgi:hypothetical protein
MFYCIAKPWLWQFLFIVLGMKCIITNSISLGCISRSGLFEISIKRKSRHLWKAMKIPDNCQWAGTVNWLIKCFLCSKVMGDNQRNVGRSTNFNRFVSYNCNPRSGHETSGSKVCPQVLTAEKKNCLFAATDLLQCAQSYANYLGNIINGEKTWTYGYNPEIKAQSSVWKTPSSQWRKKAC